MYDVIGIGEPCMDMNVNVPTFPRPNGGAKVQELSWQGGGKVSSGMVAAARLGVRGAMIAAVGEDNYGAFCRKDFERHGIDASRVVVRPGETTSLSIVLSDYETGGRSILYNNGTAQGITPEELDWAAIRDSRYLFITEISPTTLAAMDCIHDAGGKVFIDADGYSQDMMDHIAQLDLFVASEFVYNTLFGDERFEENCRSVLAMGPEVVVFTLGERGCVGISREEGFFRLPAFSVPVRDTVGAGDVYHGGFLAGWLMGLSLRETARFASAVAAIKCTRIGGRAGIPDRPTVERFLREGVIDYTEIDQRVKFYRRGLEHV